MKRIVVSSFVFSILSACGGGGGSSDGGTASSGPNNLIDGEQAEHVDIMDFQGKTVSFSGPGFAFLTFYEDGTYEKYFDQDGVLSQKSPQYTEGTWSYDGDNLTIDSEKRRLMKNSKRFSWFSDDERGGFELALSWGELKHQITSLTISNVGGSIVWDGDEFTLEECGMDVCSTYSGTSLENLDGSITYIFNDYCWFHSEFGELCDNLGIVRQYFIGRENISHQLDEDAVLREHFNYYAVQFVKDGIQRSVGHGLALQEDEIAFSGEAYIEFNDGVQLADGDY